MKRQLVTSVPQASPSSVTLADAGYTRQWRFKWACKASRIMAAEALGLRWCLTCGRELAEDARLSALYCAPACRLVGMRKRRARGVFRNPLDRPPLARGYDFKASELEHRRAETFYLIHGRSIEHAPRICRHWGASPYVR